MRGVADLEDRLLRGIDAVEVVDVVLQLGEGILRDGFGFGVSGDVDIDDGAGYNSGREEYGGEFDLGEN